jgi:hypothetical protein
MSSGQYKCNYKETVIRNYYNNLQNHLAAIDALEIKDAMKFIEESLTEIQSVQLNVGKLKSNPESSEVLITAEMNRMNNLVNDIGEKRQQLSNVITKRIEFLKSFPDIEELLKDVKEWH